MTDLRPAGGITAASMAIMYVVRIRPMRHGHRIRADGDREGVARQHRDVVDLGGRVAGR